MVHIKFGTLIPDERAPTQYSNPQCYLFFVHPRLFSLEVLCPTVQQEIRFVSQFLELSPAIDRLNEALCIPFRQNREPAAPAACDARGIAGLYVAFQN